MENFWKIKIIEFSNKVARKLMNTLFLSRSQAKCHPIRANYWGPFELDISIGLILKCNAFGEFKSLVRSLHMGSPDLFQAFFRASSHPFLRLVTRKMLL